jgi:hypothetical protein
MIDPTQPTPPPNAQPPRHAQPLPSTQAGPFHAPDRRGGAGSDERIERGGAVGHIITDDRTISRTLDRPRSAPASPWDQTGAIEAQDAAEARAARSEARRQLFAIAGELDKAERDLAAARQSGNPARIADAERVVAERAARLSEQASHTSALVSGGRESISPERVLALLAWKNPNGQRS